MNDPQNRGLVALARELSTLIRSRDTFSEQAHIQATYNYLAHEKEFWREQDQMDRWGLLDGEPTR